MYITRFFCAPEAFDMLAARALAPLVQHKEADAVIRVWVPCCATGEEPYSIAMLIREQLEMAHKSCGVQIIASDVNADALAVARKGLYPDSISADVSPGRLAHFFTKVGAHTYQVKNTLRDPMLFAVHNLLTDPPYSKLDLISCRNLIHLEADVLEKMLTRFHFILKEGGFLFLGPSHTIRGLIDLFEPVSKKRRLYRRIGPSRPEGVSYPIVAKVGATEIERRLSKESGFQSTNISKMAQRLLMEQFVPASVIINRKCEIFYFFGPCSRYLEFPTGEPTRDLMQMVPDELQTKLQVAIHRTILANKSMVVTDLRLKRNGSHRRVRVTVWPVLVPTPAEELLLITFQEEIPSEQLPDTPGSSEQMAAGNEFKIRQLEDELNVTRGQWQSTIKDLECSKEKLKASNEEVMSMNEELQSTNEQLATSKEELQALNEELHTVINHLRDKVEELETANNDISNLLNCTDMATIFLDRHFCIKLFTPAAAKLFHLIASDVGRFLSDIKLRFHDPGLLDDAQATLHQLVPREQEVSSTEGAWWLRRIMPYRTKDNRVEGLVILFMDVTERKKAADAVVLRLASIVENSLDAIISKNLEGIIQTWNCGAERLYGYTAEEIIGQSIRIVVPADRDEEWSSIMARLRDGQSVEQLETERIRKDGQRIPVVVTISPLRDNSGNVVSASTIARDISERKELEREVVEIASLEQRRIGQDLHDSVGQELTALNLLAKDLAETIPADAAKALLLTEQMIQGLHRSQQELRAVLRGLLPVAVDNEGLMAALDELAARIRRECRMACVFDCPTPVSVADNFTATHLYLIASEAVNNAVKHAQAKKIRIILQVEGGLALHIQDDGIGISPRPTENRVSGFRIMRNRAEIIGAKLTIEPTKPSGTLVTCVLARKYNEPQRSDEESSRPYR